MQLGDGGDDDDRSVITCSLIEKFAVVKVVLILNDTCI